MFIVRQLSYSILFYTQESFLLLFSFFLPRITKGDTIQMIDFEMLVSSHFDTLKSICSQQKRMSDRLRRVLSHQKAYDSIYKIAYICAFVIM